MAICNLSTMLGKDNLYTVYDKSQYYPVADNLAREMGLTKWRAKVSPSDGQLVELLKRHTTHHECCAIRCMATGIEYLIDKCGLKKYEHKTIPSGFALSAKKSDFMHSYEAQFKVPTHNLVFPDLPVYPGYSKDIPALNPYSEVAMFPDNLYKKMFEGVMIKSDTMFTLDKDRSGSMEPIKLKVEKERNPMSITSRINVSALERIANSSLNDDLNNADVQLLPENIQAALKKQLKEEAENAASAAAGEIVKLLKQHDSAVEDLVREIRDYRKAIERRLAAVKSLNNAKAFGLETSNFLPLAKSVGLCVPRGDDYVVEVPKDWASAKATVTTAE